jgi:hypothetical protein
VNRPRVHSVLEPEFPLKALPRHWVRHWVAECHCQRPLHVDVPDWESALHRAASHNEQVHTTGR